MTSASSIFRAGLLAGRVALITGGGTGIGLGAATALAAAGAEVVIANRKPEHLEPAAAGLRSLGTRLSAVEVNVREPESVGRMMEQISREHGRLDILINNAAGNFYAPSATLSPNGWRAVIETDLYGTFFCCQAAHPLMKAQGGGRIVSISMTLHYRGWPQMAHATAAKAGVDALTRTLALEWAPDRITVNAVAPGPIPTEGVKKAFTPAGGGAPASAAQLPAVAGRVLTEQHAPPVELVVAELDPGAAQPVGDGLELGPDLERGVCTRRGPMVGIEAQVHLGAIVGLVPPRTEAQRLLRRFHLAVAEDVDEELDLVVGAVGRHPEVHVVQASHGAQPTPTLW